MHHWQTTAERPKEPQGMRLEERDKELLEAIHAFDGMLSGPQIERLFFNSWRVTRERLGKLWQNGYINKPSRRQRAALPAMIYWLDSAGAEVVAGRQGVSLREFKWVSRPRWGQVEHDLAVNDFRIAVMDAAERSTFLELGVWFSEGVFRSWRDSVEYHGRDGSRRQIVTPDGYCELLMGGKKFRLLLEIDMATKDNPRFLDEKARPFLAYLRSEMYRERFGHNAGRVLVVTTGKRRLQHMKEQVEARLAKSAEIFHFTTFDDVTPASVLTEPIWYRGNATDPAPLLRPPTR